MIIKNFEIKKLDKINLNLILLYGENEGFKHSIINDFFTKNFDGEKVRVLTKEFLGLLKTEYLHPLRRT